MIDLDFTFDAAPWEKFLEDAEDTVSGAQLLTLLEGESEEVFEEAMDFLEQRGILPDLSDLPRSNGGEAAARLRREEHLAKAGIDPMALEEGDPLRLYLEEIAMIPACGDEQLLAESVAAGNQKAMEQLTSLSLSRVIDLSRGYTGWGVLLLDLIQEGSLGLWQAIDRFSGGEFAPYRDWWIQFYLAKAVLVQARSELLPILLRIFLFRRSWRPRTVPFMSLTAHAGALLLLKAPEHSDRRADVPLSAGADARPVARFPDSWAISAFF